MPVLLGDLVAWFPDKLTSSYKVSQQVFRVVHCMNNILQLQDLKKNIAFLAATADCNVAMDQILV